MNPATVLIVEDDGILAANLKDTLVDLGYAPIEPVTTGEAAIALLLNKVVDLVLMDTEPAGAMNGIEAAALIERSFGLPVVFMANFPLEPTPKQDNFSKPYSSLVKPISKRELAATLNLSLHCHALERKLKKSQQALAESETRYCNLVAHSPVGIFRSTLEGRLLSVNPEMSRMLGCDSPEEAVAHYSDLARQFYRDPARRIEFVEALLTHGSVRHFDCHAKKKNGESVWISLNARLALEDEGHPKNSAVVIDGFSLNITDQKRAETALQESEQRHRTYLNNTPYGVFSADLQGRYVQVNPAACRISGYSEHELLTMNVTDLHFEEDRRVIEHRFQTVLQQGWFTGELCIQTKSNHRRWMSLTAIKQDNDRVVGFCHDITERKQAVELLRTTLERIQVILSSLHPGILLVSGEDRVAFVNPSFCELFDLEESPEQLIGNTSSEMLNKVHRIFADPPGTMTRARQVIACLKPLRNQQIAINGGRTYLYDFVPITVGGKHVDRLWCFTDLSEQKRTEEALRENQERLQSIFRVVPAGIGHVCDRVLLEINQRACEMTGYTIEELVGRNARILYPSQEDYEYFGSEKYRQINEKGIGVVETRWQRRDGSVLDILMASTPLDPADLTKGTIFTALDITDRKRAEEENRQLLAQLLQAQKLEAIGTLAGGIAHDFNNILGAVIGYAELAKDSVDANTPLARDLDQILKAGNRAKGLVQQILAFSRQAESVPVTLYPAHIVKEVIKMLRPSLPTTIAIKHSIDAQAGPVHIDPTQLHQILMNLCTNAYHAMEAAGGTLSISLTSQEVENDRLPGQPQMKPGRYVHLAVQDTGCGIAPEVEKRIFDPFFTTKTTGKGTGMGLSILHGIVSGHGGCITLDSTPDQGSTFHVYLPVSDQPPSSTSEDTEPVPVGTEHILLVDDEETLTTMIKEILERLGYRVTVRTSSLEAMATFQNHVDQFDLVITDQTMPGMTGMDLARRMIQMRPDIPIILCTGFSTQISEEKAKAAGIREFALKPLTKSDLASLIRKVLGTT
jgi:PAS domain S-box-containing protein